MEEMSGSSEVRVATLNLWGRRGELSASTRSQLPSQGHIVRLPTGTRNPHEWLLPRVAWYAK